MNRTKSHLSAIAAAFAFTVLHACGNSREMSQSEEVGSTGSPGSAASSPPSAPLMADQSAERSAAGMTKVAADAAQTPPGQASAAADANAPSMIIRNGDASIKVDSLETAIALVRQLAQRLGGVVANTQLSTGENQVRSAMLQLRIPATRFDEALAGLAPIGKTENVTSTSEDVGEEYVDLTARVTNSRRLEERLITLLATRTGKLEDVLAVERELARVREEIERVEGRMRYLRTRAATSTLTINLHEPFPIVGNNPGEGVISQAFVQAWRNFVRLIAGLIASMGVLIPIGALVVVAWLVVRRLRGRKMPPTDDGAAQA